MTKKRYHFPGTIKGQCEVITVARSLEEAISNIKKGIMEHTQSEWEFSEIDTEDLLESVNISEHEFEETLKRITKNDNS